MLFAMTTVRNANLLDTPEIDRLLAAASHHSGAESLGTSDVNALLDRGHLLVLARSDGGVDAVAHVDVSAGRATLDLLVVDPVLIGTEIEQRMTGVARALCEAYGCEHVVVTPRRASRGRR
jgi:hypothetical protein